MMAPGENKSSSSSPSPPLEIDPLLKDLTEMKLNFRKNVVSLAAELKDMRNRLALQEESFIRETRSRQVAEKKAKSMEEEIGKLQSCLEEKNMQLNSSTSNTKEVYLVELHDLRSQLSFTQATAEASAASAQSAQSQYLSLLTELEEKNNSLKANEIRVCKLGEQLNNLQKDLQERESIQIQMKEEVLRTEKEIMQAVAIAGVIKDCELRKLLEEVSPKNFENITKLLDVRDGEIAKLRDEIRFLSSHWKHKTKELESQVEKYRRSDQELKNKVFKLEFCVQDLRSQMRKLHKAAERRDKALKEYKDQVTLKQHNEAGSNDKENFWESPGFKVIMSMSMLILVAFTRQ